MWWVRWIVVVTDDGVIFLGTPVMVLVTVLIVVSGLGDLVGGRGHGFRDFATMGLTGGFW